MRLKFGNIEVEGKDMAEVKALLELAQSESLMGKSSNAPSAAYVRRGTEITFPEGEFTVAEAVEFCGVSQPTIQNKLTAMLDSGDAEIVGSKGGGRGRGRASRVWRVINQPAETKEKIAEIDLDHIPVDD